MLRRILYFTLILGVFACETSNSGQGTGPVAPTITDNGKTGFDWAGTYKGVLPCADCKGLATSVRLNEDQTYVLRYQYKGKSDEIVEYRGSFEWADSGNVIFLREAGTGEIANSFLIAENKLTQLDRYGNPMKGKPENNYELKKFKNGIEGKYWRLNAINDEPVKYLQKTNKEVFIYFSDTSGQMAGQADCNVYFGSYEMKEGGGINLKGIGSTLMACQEMERENYYLKTLDKVNQFMHSGDTLTLISSDKLSELQFIFEPTK